MNRSIHHGGHRVHGGNHRRSKEPGVRPRPQAPSPMSLSPAITSALGTLSRGSESIEAVLNRNPEENRFTRALQDLQRLAEHCNGDCRRKERGTFPRQPLMRHSARILKNSIMHVSNMPHHVGERYRDFGIFLYVSGKVNVALPHRCDSR